MKKKLNEYKTEFLDNLGFVDNLDNIKKDLKFNKNYHKPNFKLPVFIFASVLLIFFIVSMFFVIENSNVPVFKSFEVCDNAQDSKKLNGTFNEYFDDDFNNPNIDYYTNKNNDLTLKISLDNKKQYEILSVVINGIKYQSFNFLEYSTSSDIYILINSGNISGIVNLYIDEIKYIKDKNIKQVKYDGDREITLGVKYEDMPYINESSVDINYNYINITGSLVNTNNLINNETSVIAFLTNNNKVISYKNIDYNNISVMFDNLLPGSMYEVVVVAGINVLDKDNYDPVVIYEYQFKTKEIINILNINNLEDSVNILINPLFDICIDKITDINNNLYEFSFINNTINMLDTNYVNRLYVHYSFTNDSKIYNYVLEVSINYYLPAPTFSGLMFLSGNTLNIDLEVKNNLSSLVIDSINLYLDDELYKSLDEINTSCVIDKSFNNALLKINYHYINEFNEIINCEYILEYNKTH